MKKKAIEHSINWINGRKYQHRSRGQAFFDFMTCCMAALLFKKNKYSSRDAIGIRTIKIEQKND